MAMSAWGFEKGDVYWQDSARGVAANLDQLAAGDKVTKFCGSWSRKKDYGSKRLACGFVVSAHYDC